jgi:hypothetical protein
MQFRRRRGPNWNVIGIAVAVVVVGAVGAVFFYAGEAEKNPPAQTEIKVEAQNVGGG